MKLHTSVWATVVFCNEFLRSALYYAILPLVLTHRFDISIGWVGFCTSCQFAADAITKMFYGVVGSRGHSRFMLRVGTAISGLSVVGLLFIHAPHALLIFSILFGCGAASVWPAALAYHSGHDSKSRGESMAFIFVPWLGGTGAGIFLTNFLLYHHSIMRLALPSVAVVVFLGTFVLDLPKSGGKTSWQRELAIIQILSRRMKVFLPPMLVQTLVIGTVTPFLTLFAVRALNFSPSQYALLLVGIGSITVLLLLPFGKVSDRFGRLPLLAASTLTSSISLLGLGTSQGWVQALISAAIFGAGYGALFPAWNALFLDNVPRWLQTRAVGVFTAVEDSGTVLGPFIGALGWQYIGSAGPFIIGGVLMAVLAVYFAVWWKISTATDKAAQPTS